MEFPYKTTLGHNAGPAELELTHQSKISTYVNTRFESFHSSVPVALRALVVMFGTVGIGER